MRLDARLPRSGDHTPAHADDWLRDLSGIDPADHPDWATYLTAAHYELCTRYSSDPESPGRGAIGWIGLAVAELAASDPNQAGMLEGAAYLLGHAETLAAMGLINDAPGQCC